MKFSKQVRIHVLCWLIFILYEVLVVSIISERFGDFWTYLLAYLTHISLFYFHAYVTVPKSLENKKTSVWKVPLLWGLELGCYVLIYSVLNLGVKSLLQSQIINVLAINFQYFAGVLYRGIYFMLLSTGYYYLISFIQNKKQEVKREVQVEQLKSELLQAEIDYLRAQINPHLLFNTLNFIKYSSKYSPEDARKAITYLSNILDFATQGANKDKVKLIDEVEQVNNLISLHQLRFDNRLNIRFHQRIQDGDVSVIPIVLLTLVENVFKHGNLEVAEFPADIYVESNSSSIIYRTSNLLKEDDFLRSNKTGLKNIQLRLEKLFPDKFSFNYGVEGRLFKLELRINY